MNRYKTPEEIEAQKKLLSERYPEPTSSNVDPTQPARDALKRLFASAFKPDSELGIATQNMRTAGIPKQEFEMSPEIKKYGYDLFGIKDLAGDVEQQIPFAPVSEETQPEMQKMPEESKVNRSPAIEQELPSKPFSAMPKVEAQPTPQPTLEAETIPQVPQEQRLSPPAELSEEDLLKQSQEEEDRALLWRQAAKLRDAIMGAGSGTIIKTDESLYDELQKRAQRPLKNLLLSKELKQKREKDDPNSEISKMMRKTLSDMGMDISQFKNVSYSQLEKIYPSLTNAISTKIAAQAKKEEADFRRSELAIRKQEQAIAKINKLNEDDQKIANSHIDFAMRQLNKPYTEYEKSAAEITSLNQIIKDVKGGKISPGASDITLLYSVIKGFDPTSTVRDSEIKLSASAMSLWGRIRQGIENKTEGALLDPTTRESFEQILKVIQASREKSFARSKAALIKAGEGKGISADVLEDSIYPEINTKDIRSGKKQMLEDEEAKPLTIEDRMAEMESRLKANQERINSNQQRIEMLKKKKMEGQGVNS